MDGWKDDGGAAFPRIYQVTEREIDGVTRQSIVEGADGLTKREWFAGQALAGLASRHVVPGSRSEAVSAAEIARQAYEIADTMIKAGEDDR